MKFLPSSWVSVVAGSWAVFAHRLWMSQSRLTTPKLENLAQAFLSSCSSWGCCFHVIIQIWTGIIHNLRQKENSFVRNCVYFGVVYCMFTQKKIPSQTEKTRKITLETNSIPECNFVCLSSVCPHDPSELHLFQTLVSWIQVLVWESTYFWWHL